MNKAKLMIVVILLSLFCRFVHAEVGLSQKRVAVFVWKHNIQTVEKYMP